MTHESFRTKALYIQIMMLEEVIHNMTSRLRLKEIGIVTALVLSMFMAAIESSIVSLAIPTISDDLHVKGSVSLVFSVYFIAIVIATPIVGELLERTKIIYLSVIGLILFTIGSLFSGLSPTFTILIISRFLQGLGAGVLMALGQIVPKLAFEIPLRYKVMGIVGSVWGIASIVGPLLGGGILEFATWHWLFFVNVPIAMLALVLVFATFHFENESTTADSRLDMRGMMLFYLMIACFLCAVMNQTHMAINVVALLLMIIVGYILYRFEHRQTKPFIPVIEFNKTATLIFFTDFCYAFMLMGYNIYMPIYLQEEIGLSPLQSGLTVFPLSFAWLILNMTLDKIEVHFTRKGIYIFAFTLLYICGALVFIGATAPLFIALSLLLAGFSFGTIYTKDSVIIQEESSEPNMKRMMSLYALTKSLGSSVGATVMGYIYTLSIVFTSSEIQNIVLMTFIMLTLLIVLWLIRFKHTGIFSNTER